MEKEYVYQRDLSLSTNNPCTGSAMQSYEDPDGPMGQTEEESRQANIETDSAIKRVLTVVTLGIIMAMSWIATGQQT